MLAGRQRLLIVVAGVQVDRAARVGAGKGKCDARAASPRSSHRAGALNVIVITFSALVTLSTWLPVMLGSRPLSPVAGQTALAL